MASAAIKYVPQTASTTFAFSSVFILLLWINCKCTATFLSDVTWKKSWWTWTGRLGGHHVSWPGRCGRWHAGNHTFQTFSAIFSSFSATFQVLSRHFVELANGNFESDQQNNTWVGQLYKKCSLNFVFHLKKIYVSIKAGAHGIQIIALNFLYHLSL